MKRRKYHICVFLLFFGFVVIGAGSHGARRKKPDDTDRSRNYSLTEAEDVALPARKARYPVYVYGDESGQRDRFVASGYMGDMESFKKVTSSKDSSAPASFGVRGKTSLQIRYKPIGRHGWAGIYWLAPANNWGKIKGAGFDLSEAERLTFWMRGERGGEKISEVKIGGINGPYPDTDVVTFGPIRLTKEWRQFTIPLDDKDMRHIVGGFAIILRRRDNPKGAIFYLDEIVYRGPNEKITTTPILAEMEPEGTKDVLVEPIRRVILFSSAERKSYTEETKSKLNEIVDLANRYKNSVITLEGHTDSMGSASFNMTLSKQRAMAVSAYLKEKGLEETRMSAIGYGEEKPIASNETKDGRIKNRRVEVVLEPKSKGKK